MDNGYARRDGPRTMKAAAASIRHDVEAMRAKILARLRDEYRLSDTDARGMTCDELEVDLGFSHQTCSARLRGLFQDGLIDDSGRTRQTRSGRAAMVRVAPDRTVDEAIRLKLQRTRVAT